MIDKLIREYIIARMDDEQEALEEFVRIGAKEAAAFQRSLLGNNAAIISFIDSLQEEPVSEFLNIESMIESYKQRLISQANGMKNSPLIDMCLASYKHGINETLDILNLSNVERTVKDWKEEPVSEDFRKYMKGE